jgi:hypothetical protein
MVLFGSFFIMRKNPNQVLIDLNDHWRLEFDDIQWIVSKKRVHYDKSFYRPVAFVAGFKATLERVLVELDVTPTDAANSAVSQLPETFKAFLLARDAEGDCHDN